MIPIKLTALLSIVFAATCLWFAVDAFTSLSTIADPVERSGERDFALFWGFLAVVGAAIAWIAWKVAGSQTGDED
jgi:hypothetical protein